MDDVLKIAIGVFIGALAAAFTWEGIQMVRVEIALKKASDEMKRAAEQVQARSRADQARNESEAREQRARQQLIAEAQQLERLRKADREAAFTKFFQPTENCRKDAVQAICANAYMKAKTVFDSQYQPTR